MVVEAIEKSEVLNKVRKYLGREVIVYLHGHTRLKGKIEGIESSYHKGIGNLILNLSENYKELRRGSRIIIRGRSVEAIAIPYYNKEQI